MMSSKRRMKLKFKCNKLIKRQKPIKLRFFNTAKFPARSKAEWRLIDRNPFGDADRDGVPNWFDCKPLDRRKQGWAHEGTMLYYPERKNIVKMMSPDKFMRTTYIEILAREEKGERRLFKTPRSYEDYSKQVVLPENVEKLKKVIQQPKGKMNLPFLEYDEKGRPIGHEGRHRATAAKELGIKLIPVTIIKHLKEKDQPDHIDYEEAELKNKKMQNIASADIPIKEQREYGEEKPEAIQSVDKPIEIQEED